MSVRTYSTTLLGIDALKVEVEAQVITGLKRFSIVGLPDGVVKEAKDRVKCALENSGFEFPQSEVIVSLAPATLPKIGSGFDLAIAVSILAANFAIPEVCLRGKVFVGELALDGRIKQTGSELASAFLVKENTKGESLVASISARNSLAYFPEFPVIYAESLTQLVGVLLGKATVIKIENEQFPKVIYNNANQRNFSDVIGQHAAKRALQVAAAGGHNLLMIGPPGGGKTMLAERLISILPDLNKKEFLEVNKIHSAFQGHIAVSGEYKPKFNRQFRAPHHSISVAGLVGGGSQIVPGEITLAHHGILFLDELPELRRDVLEALREPIEKHKISISRAQSKFTYPSNFMLLAAMNPCPCGLRGLEQNADRHRARYRPKCKCTEVEVRKYIKKISGPLLDRIDIQLWIPQVSIDEMQSVKPVEDLTKKLKEGVINARNRQLTRFKSQSKVNSQMTSNDLAKYCLLKENSKALLNDAGRKFNLSARAFTRILKLSRTIADLKEADSILDEHVAEALSYRLQLSN